MGTTRAKSFQILTCLLFAFAATTQTGFAEEPLWSLRPMASPRIPKSQNPDSEPSPVDSLILAALKAKGLEPRPEASRAALIRRLSFDLHGVPPTPEEVRQFEADPSPSAHADLVDRLLASPKYGERWARHWLDVVRFTESQGFEYDHFRPNAWRYRDYVIQSFNQDKPYDQFVREQIAGDVLEPDSREAIVATSLLVCGPWDQAGSGQANVALRNLTREEEMEDLVGTISQAILGVTVNCARCHDHKFDPVPQVDYYRMKAVFDGVRHGDRPIPTRGEEEARKAELERLKEANPAKEAYEAAARKLPPFPVAYVGHRQQPEPTRLLKRGDVKSPGDVVRPGGLSAISPLSGDFGLEPDAPEAERRRRFALWLTDPANPLTARVMANRVWHWHFGRGIVSTPSDLGMAGAKPTHPELLDWLASQLIQSGWSLKSLHRVILNSDTYKRASSFDPAAAAVDADNQLLWRASPRRLDAESVRDSMLAISGQMNWAMGGPSFQPFKVTNFGSSSYFPFDASGPEFDRRTVYRANVNSGKDPFLDTLDCPDPSIRTPVRTVTLTPLQALSLMNNPFVRRQSEALARKVLADASGSVDAAVDLVYEHILGRPPTGRERTVGRGVAADRGLWRLCWILFNSTEFLYVR